MDVEERGRAWFTVLSRKLSKKMTKNHENLLISIDCVQDDIRLEFHYCLNQHNRRITGKWKKKKILNEISRGFMPVELTYIQNHTMHTKKNYFKGLKHIRGCHN